MQVMTQYKGISHGRNIVLPPRSTKTKTVLIYGLPGCGKSRFIYETYPDAFWKSPDSTWFDGYSGQSEIIFDDFYGWIPLATLLRLTDRYPLIVQTKGGHATFQAKRCIISSNALPEDWYKSAIEKTPWLKRALHRRIDALIIANSGGPDNWAYYYGQEACRKLEDSKSLRDEAGLDGIRLDDIPDGKKEVSPIFRYSSRNAPKTPIVDYN